MRLEDMPLQLRQRIQAELSAVWDMKRALEARVAELEGTIREGQSVLDHRNQVCDRYKEALEAILANEEAYNRGDALSAYIAKTALGIPV